MTADRDLAERLLGLIDLTSLNDARDDDIAGLCDAADTEFGAVAAVCSWPTFTKEMKERLAGTGIPVAVVTNFPHGRANIAAAVEEAATAAGKGADEIDLVWPYREWLAGHELKAMEMITEVKGAIGPAVLKVILETGALGDPMTIRSAADDALTAGADVLKTSTGKIEIGATPEAAQALLMAIKASGRDAGFKASGGIRSLEDAETYLQLAEITMGPDWIDAKHFRIGASSLLAAVLEVLKA